MSTADDALQPEAPIEDSGAPEQSRTPEPAGTRKRSSEAKPHDSDAALEVTRARRGRLGKRNALLAVLLPAVVLLGVATRPWATGSAGDVLASGVTEVAGTTAAPGAIGLTAVAVVALLGLLTGGRIIRTVSAGVVVVASLAVLALTLVVALAPVQTVADAVARELARTTAPDTVGASTAWVWLALGVTVVLVAGSVAAAFSSQSWAGLSRRYERGSRPASGPRGQTLTAWEELSEGGDPTEHDDRDST